MTNVFYNQCKRVLCLRLLCFYGLHTHLLLKDMQAMSRWRRKESVVKAMLITFHRVKRPYSTGLKLSTANQYTLVVKYTFHICNIKFVQQTVSIIYFLCSKQLYSFIHSWSTFATRSIANMAHCPSYGFIVNVLDVKIQPALRGECLLAGVALVTFSCASLRFHTVLKRKTVYHIRNLSWRANRRGSTSHSYIQELTGNA